MNNDHKPPTPVNTPRRPPSGLGAKSVLAVCIVAAVAGALAFRLPRLDLRPMHTDEAVQAYKTGQLLDTGTYRYDPHEYHGPTLYYLTLPVAWLSAERTFAATHETTFRLVPVVFGVALVALVWFLSDGLSPTATAWAAAMTALSPAMVFYSRYYIQEMLLVFFTFLVIVAGWRYACSRSWRWAVTAGAGVGLMHATKETCLIAYAAMLAALVLTMAWGHRRGPTTPQGSALARIRDCLPDPRHVVVAAVVAGTVSALFFSSFLTHPAGPVDSVRAYANFLRRSGGAVIHHHPWHYYLGMLIYTKRAAGPWWSEGIIIVLSVVGLIGAVTARDGAGGNRRFIRFIAIYALLMTCAYAAIPYKTPWCALGFLHGLILLAGVGAATLVRRTPNRLVAGAVAAILALGVSHLGLQAYRGSFRYYADVRNPYVYAHTATDLVRLADRVHEISQVHPDGDRMPITIIKPDAGYWPLPWYLRRFEYVGYWTTLPDQPDAPVIITTPAVRPEVDSRLRDTYHVEHYGLRPGVLLLAYVRSDLWEAFLNTRR